ncbi:MFS-type efflux pump MSMEG_3705-like [Ptychodera flava]|uniref:MFS-type efflux pump MSMEG_3705-like n=1 Tax=Ptychodera flava TaxID=63121 RepID=UPI003969CD68
MSVPLFSRKKPGMGQRLEKFLRTESYDADDELSPSQGSSMTLRALGSLLILFMVYVFTQADRQLLPALIPSGLRCYPKAGDDKDHECSIYANKSDGFCSPEDCITLNDFQHAALTGLAYVFAYLIAGIPIGRLADLSSRVKVVGFGVFVWCAMVLITGLSNSFWVMLLARVGVGVGEVSCNPSSYAMLSDLFYTSRTKALAFYHLGFYIGSSLGFAVGATNVVLCWRWPFFFLAFAGFIMVVIIVLFLKDPEPEERILPEPVPQSCKETALQLLKSKPYIMICIASSVRMISAFALLAWLPTFYARKYNLPADEYSGKLALIVLVGGCTGSLTAGYLADRASVNKKQAKAYVIGLSQLLATPLVVGAFAVDEQGLSFFLFFLSYIFSETWIGVSATIVQDLTVPDIRAQSSAVYVVFHTLIGGTLGPLLGAILLEKMYPQDVCDENIGHVLIIVVPVCYGLSAILYTVVGILIKKQIEGHSISYLHFDTAELEGSTTSVESEAFNLVSRNRSYQSGCT